MDFAFCQAPVCASSPGPPVIMPANSVEQTSLSLDGSFSLTAEISAASFHDYHSLTDSTACRKCQDGFLQAGYLPEMVVYCYCHSISLNYISNLISSNSSSRDENCKQ